MKGNSSMTNGLAEPNHHVQNELKETQDGVMGEGQELSEEDESQINEDVENVNDGHAEIVQGQASGHSPRLQQHSQRPLVHWESFLPLRSLKVLLVENDDSTRHVVSALLRNCGYEVTAVENGLQAWKLLEDLTNHFDLVLTEVVMPFVSGIGLLCKIMNHKTCKNTPVIMMSSHDSMSIVFKCLSKGAVDFLVKPIRKNELKNLWQHVWRKCHSSSGSGSGSGSESGVQTQKSTKSKIAESDNKSGSNDEDGIESIGLNARDGSDHGSGTQSSWTKKAIEVDSPKLMSPRNHVAEPPDSTCAQVIHSRPEASGNNWVLVTTIKGQQGQDDDDGNGAMGNDLETKVPRFPNFQLEHPGEKIEANVSGNQLDKLHGLNSMMNAEKIENAHIEIKGEKQNGDSRNSVAADVMGIITNSTNPQMRSVVFDFPNNLSKVSNQNDMVVCKTKDVRCVDLSLKRLNDDGDTGSSAHDRNVLRHSDLSAFSRYNSVSAVNQATTGNVASCSPLDNSSGAIKTDSIQNFQSNSNSTPPNQRSNGSCNNIDMGSTTNNAFSKPVFSDKPAPKSTSKGPHNCSAFRAVQNGQQHKHLPQPGNDAAANPFAVQARDANQQVQVEHHHHHHHHHYHHQHHHVHMSQQQQQQQLANDDDSSPKNMAAGTPQCGSSNRLRTPAVGVVGNYSLNRSASGSEHGSNGLNGSSTALNLGPTNIERENVVAGNIGTTCGMGGRSVVDQNHSGHREAALNKFRQKRKHRCFEKKVRYQSRKKLAEQRPRIRGQFVRQAANGNKGKDALS